MPSRRPKSEAERLTTLLHLVRLGAGSSFAKVSTRTLGESIGLSQQAASLRLIDLEEAGLVERGHSGRGLGVRLTERGLKVAGAFLAETSSRLAIGEKELRFTGTVFSGFNEGGYYVSLKGYARSFSRVLGFTPFPGTLNLRLTSEAMVEQRRRLETAPGFVIPGFSDGRRSYGPVKCFRSKIEGSYEGAVLAIERTHYDSTVLEAIAPVNLRRSLHLKDGDRCEVLVFLDDVRGRRP